MAGLYRKIITCIMILVLVTGASGCSTGPFSASSKKVVEVKSVGAMNGYMYYGESEEESHTGTVSSDYVQQVIVDSSMTVEKI